MGSYPSTRGISRDQSKLDRLNGASLTSAASPDISAEGEYPILKDLARFEEVVRECRSQFGRGGKFLFGKFTIADAVLSPVLLFFDTHAVAVETETRMYMNAVLTTDAMASWREGVSAHSLGSIPSKSALRAAL